MKEEMNIREQFLSIERLYHFTKFDTAVKIIESGGLRYSKVCNTNDFLERSKVFGVTLDLTVNIGERFQELKDEFYRYRLICLTEDKENSLGFTLNTMWGYYADKCMGVCFVFDKSKLVKQALSATCQSVEYTNEATPNYSYDTRSISLLFQKRKEWEYEQEYRIVKISENEDTETLKIRDALKFVIISGENGEGAFENEECRKCRLQKSLDEANLNVPVLVYGTGFNNFNLLSSDHKWVVWDAVEGFEGGLRNITG